MNNSVIKLATEYPICRIENIMNLMTNKAKTATQTSSGSARSDGSNAADFDIASSSYMHKKKSSSAHFGRESHDVEVMQNTKSVPLDNGQFPIFCNLNSDMYLNTYIGYNYSVNAYTSIEDVSGVSEDHVFLPFNASTSKCIESVKDNVDVKQPCTNENSNNDSRKCSYCNASFSSIDNLLKHIKAHKEKERQHCPKCKKTFAYYKSMKSHLMIMHSDQGPGFICSECGDRFYYKHYLKRHLKNMHEFVMEKCDLESMKDTENASLNKDKFSISENSNVDKYCDSVEGIGIKVQENKKTYACTQCKSIFCRQFDLKMHWDDKHNGKECKHKCSVCIKSFFFEKNLKKHMANEHQLTRESNEIYVIKNTVSASLGNDKSSIVDNENIDKYEDSDRGILQPCINKTEKNKMFVCTYCNITFSQLGSLYRHQLKGHKKKGSFFCPECNAVYTRKSTIIKHMAKIHNWALDMCDIEGLYDAVNVPLKKKEISILENNSMDKYYDSDGGLDVGGGDSMNTYLCMGEGDSDVGEIKLDELLSVGSVNDNVDEKQLPIRERIAKFVCDFCGKKYFQRITLDRHCREIHTDKTRYICPKCGISCIRKLNLKRHMVKVHKLTLKQCDVECMKNTENALLDKNKEPILGNINIDKFYDSEGGLDVGKNNAMNKDLNLGIEDGRVDSGTNDDNVLFIEDRISKSLESANNNLNVKQDQTNVENKKGVLLCYYCGDQFTKKWFLSEHLDSQHQSKDVLHKCFLCNTVFANWPSLRRHGYDQHSNRERKEKCPFCDKRFLYESLLNLHLVSAHDKKNSPYRCVKCDRYFQSRAHKERHERSKMHINNMSLGASTSS